MNVVVTGGAQGIGLAITQKFLTLGATVFALDSDLEALEELGPSVTGILCDVGEVAQVEAACKQIEGPVDLLINNAGIGGDWKPIWEASLEDWDRVLAVNLRSGWLMTKCLVDKMPEGASIVNIASTRALMSEPNTEPYSASKGGIVALTHSLAVSLAERKIRVNCISPGWIETAAHQKESRRKSPTLRPVDHDQHPAGRVGVPEDIADAVAFLASAGFVTGTNLVVDGGMTRKMIYQE